MPLDRENVTAASRLMLPAYVLLAGWLGIIYLFDPLGRVDRNPGLAFARLVFPMPVWGICFLAVAGLMAAALLSHRRGLFIYALWVYFIAALAWMCIYAAALWVSSEASLVAPAWPAFVAVCCLATKRSLNARGV